MIHAFPCTCNPGPQPKLYNKKPQLIKEGKFNKGGRNNPPTKSRPSKPKVQFKK